MFSRFFLFFAGGSYAVLGSASSRVPARRAPVSVKFGGALRWSHAELSMNVKSTAVWKSGFVVAQEAFNRQASHWTVGEVQAPRDGSLVGVFNSNRRLGVYDDGRGVYDADVYRLDAGGGRRRVAVADIPALEDIQKESTLGFLRTLNWGDVRVWQFDVGGANYALVHNAIALNTAEHKAEWLFGRDYLDLDNGGRTPYDGVVSPVADRSVSAEFTQTFEFNRPAIDLFVKAEFALNSSMSLVADVGYGMVFGKPVEKEAFNLCAAHGKDETVETVLGHDQVIKGGLPLLGFVNSAGCMYSSVKTETSLKEGLKAFAGFVYSPDPRFFVSFSAGVKSYKIAMDVSRGVFHYPHSSLYHSLSQQIWESYDLKSKTKLRFERNIYPLAFKAEFGALVSGLHSFSVSLEYVSTSAELYASSKQSGDSFDAESKDNKEVTVYSETYTLPVDALDEASHEDFSIPGGLTHMSDADQVTVKHSANVTLRDLSVGVSYALKI